MYQLLILIPVAAGTSDITVTLLDLGTADPAYTLADPDDHKASVTVNDTAFPELSITAGSAVTESASGVNATFTITSTTAITGNSLEY